MTKKSIKIPNEPTAEDFKDARYHARLTQKEASTVIFSGAESHRTVQNWETGARKIPRGMYVLFLLMTGQMTLKQARKETGLLK